MSDRLRFGIDIGTVNTTVSLYYGGIIEHVYDDDKNVIPSCVFLSRDGKLTCGFEAKKKLDDMKLKQGVIFDIKRMIGLNSSELHKFIRDNKHTCKVVTEGDLVYLMPYIDKDVRISPEEALNELVKYTYDLTCNFLESNNPRLEKEFGSSLKNVKELFKKGDYDVVFSNPSTFSNLQIRLLRDAAERSGWIGGNRQFRSLTEPYCVILKECGKILKCEGTKLSINYKPEWDMLCVIDLGGGTFDICLCEHKGVQNGMFVLETISDTGIPNGGRDLDRDFRKVLEKKYNDLGLDPYDLTYSKVEGYKLAHYNLERKAAEVYVPNEEIYYSLKGDFDKVTEDFFGKIKPKIDELFDGVGSKKAKYVFVGGSINVIRERLNGYVDDCDVIAASDEKLCVSMGACTPPVLFILKDIIKDNVRLKYNDIDDIIFNAYEQFPIEKIEDLYINKLRDASSLSLYGDNKGQIFEKKLDDIAIDVKMMKSAKLHVSIDDNRIISAKLEYEKETELDYDLDIVFMIDATGSMKQEIEFIKTDIETLIDAFRSKRGDSCYFGFVFYRDPINDERSIHEKYELSNDINVIKQQIQGVEAKGGGDNVEEDYIGGYENVIEIFRNKFREPCRRVIIQIGDASSHGFPMNGVLDDRYADITRDTVAKYKELSDIVKYHYFYIPEKAFKAVRPRIIEMDKKSTGLQYKSEKLNVCKYKTCNDLLDCIKRISTDITRSSSEIGEYQLF